MSWPSRRYGTGPHPSRRIRRLRVAAAPTSSDRARPTESSQYSTCSLPTWTTSSPLVLVFSWRSREAARLWPFRQTTRVRGMERHHTVPDTRWLANGGQGHRDPTPVGERVSRALLVPRLDVRQAAGCARGSAPQRTAEGPGGGHWTGRPDASARGLEGSCPDGGRGPSRAARTPLRVAPAAAENPDDYDVLAPASLFSPYLQRRALVHHRVEPRDRHMLRLLRWGDRLGTLL